MNWSIGNSGPPGPEPHASPRHSVRRAMRIACIRGKLPEVTACTRWFPGGLPMQARNVLVIGGAGFVGSNLTHHLLTQGCSVTVFDALYRPGVDINLRWL